MKNDKIVILNESELKSLQQKGLDILREVIQAINKMGLTYYCVGGTALGAVKYGGFIPWDDDIDIAMPREDYMLFLEKGSSYLPANLKICSCFTEPNNFSSLTKVRDENTAFFDIETAKYNVSHGIFIDIFPIDGYKKTTKYESFIKKILLGKIEFYKTTKKRFKIFLKTLICNLLCPFKSLNKCAISVERKLMKQSIDSSSQVFNRIMVFDKEIFGTPKFGKFDNLIVNLPQEVDEYLKICYGDIKLDPPIEKQIPHHFTALIDVKTSYKKYVYTRKGIRKVC